MTLGSFLEATWHLEQHGARDPRTHASPRRYPSPKGTPGFGRSLEPWQAAIARRVDALVNECVPGVRKAIRWHSPMYGVEGKGWFLAFAAFQRHIKFSFFRGASLEPVPPVGRFKGVRSLDVRESDPLDEKLLARWIERAASIPGWDGGSPRNGGASL